LKSKNVLEKKMTQMNYGIATQSNQTQWLWQKVDNLMPCWSHLFHWVFTKLHWQQLINRLSTWPFATFDPIIYVVTYVTKFKTLCISVFYSFTICLQGAHV
jgi:hypothetical protein